MGICGSHRLTEYFSSNFPQNYKQTYYQYKREEFTSEVGCVTIIDLEDRG
ncbi:MAG: hypothetical protein STSR0002_21420 [Smithella sp.]